MYCLDLTAITYFGNITIWYVLALGFLLDRRLQEKGRRMHYVALVWLLLWCIAALIFGRFAERLYAVVTICGVTTVELLIRRKRSLAERKKDVA